MYYYFILIGLIAISGILSTIFKPCIYISIIGIVILLAAYFRTEYEKRIFVKEVMMVFRNYREIMRDNYSLDD